jgi:hypothetical protein
MRGPASPFRMVSRPPASVADAGTEGGSDAGSSRLRFSGVAANVVDGSNVVFRAWEARKIP